MVVTGCTVPYKGKARDIVMVRRPQWYLCDFKHSHTDSPVVGRRKVPGGREQQERETQKLSDPTLLKAVL